MSVDILFLAATALSTNLLASGRLSRAILRADGFCLYPLARDNLELIYLEASEMCIWKDEVAMGGGLYRSIDLSLLWTW